MAEHVEYFVSGVGWSWAEKEAQIFDTNLGIHSIYDAFLVFYDSDQA